MRGERAHGKRGQGGRWHGHCPRRWGWQMSERTLPRGEAWADWVSCLAPGSALSPPLSTHTRLTPPLSPHPIITCSERAYRCSVCRTLFTTPPPRSAAAARRRRACAAARACAAVACVLAALSGAGGSPPLFCAALLALLLLSGTRSHALLAGAALLAAASLVASMAHSRGVRVVVVPSAAAAATTGRPPPPILSSPPLPPKVAPHTPPPPPQAPSPHSRRGVGATAAAAAAAAGAAAALTAGPSKNAVARRRAGMAAAAIAAATRVAPPAALRLGPGALLAAGRALDGDPAHSRAVVLLLGPGPGGEVAGGHRGVLLSQPLGGGGSGGGGEEAAAARQHPATGGLHHFVGGPVGLPGSSGAGGVASVSIVHALPGIPGARPLVGTLGEEEGAPPSSSPEPLFEGGSLSDVVRASTAAARVEAAGVADASLAASPSSPPPPQLVAACGQLSTSTTARLSGRRARWRRPLRPGRGGCCPWRRRTTSWGARRPGRRRFGRPWWRVEARVAWCGAPARAGAGAVEGLLGRRRWQLGEGDGEATGTHTPPCPLIAALLSLCLCERDSRDRTCDRGKEESEREGEKNARPCAPPDGVEG